MEAVQLLGRLEGSHFFGKWRFDGSPAWFDFDFEKGGEDDMASSSFKGHFQLKNKSGVHKIAETLTLTSTKSDSEEDAEELVGTGSNMFGEFQLWGKRDEKTNAFEGFKKYTVLREQQQQQKKSTPPIVSNNKHNKKKKSFELPMTLSAHDLLMGEPLSVAKKPRLMMPALDDTTEDIDDDDDDVFACVQVRDVVLNDDQYDSTEELMEELQMIQDNGEVEALSDDELINVDRQGQQRARLIDDHLIALSSPSSPTSIGRVVLNNEPLTIDVSPISPMMMLPSAFLPLPPTHTMYQRLSPHPLRMDASPDDEPPLVSMTAGTIAEPIPFERRPTSLSQCSVTSSATQSQHPSVNKSMYSVRMTTKHESEFGNPLETVKSRARKRIRDFVIGLQSRHFYPYDPNDLALGLPEIHPLHAHVQIVKVDPSSSPATLPGSPTLNGATIQQPATLKEKKKKNGRRSSPSICSSPPTLMPSSSSESLSDNEQKTLLMSSIPSRSNLRHPGSTRTTHPAPASKLQNPSAKIEHQLAKFEIDGSCYEGEMLAGLRHGLGVAGYWNGFLYVGEFRKGAEHGIGELRDASGALIFRGEFEQGRICGHGTFYYPDGSVYRGEMREGSRHGKGIIWYQDGSVYEGDFVHGVRSGQGTYIAVDGAQFCGEWSQDVRHGKGTLKLSDGTVLDGQFKDNQPDGRCAVTFSADGSVYEGNFKDGLKDGRGTYIFGRYGAVYEGRFSRDLIGGIGTLKLAQSVPIELPDPIDFRRSEWMMPIDLQCEIRSVHLKAGFASDGT
jgi:hypothetical protein